MAIIVPNGDFLNNQAFILIILLIVLLQLRQRRVKLWSLLIMPLFMFLITLSVVNNELYSIFNIVLISAGLFAGILIGILIGKFMEVKIDEDGTMLLKGSYIAIIMWIAIIAVKIYGKNVLGSTGIGLNLLTSIFLMITLGAMISRRAFIYWKYLNHKKELVAIN
jgi:membrane protein CcdC involved in cytochrome C biogenesis